MPRPANKSSPAKPGTPATPARKTRPRRDPADLDPPLPPVVDAPEPPPDLSATALGKASDEELMRRTQNGDEQAFALLYERYSQPVLSFLYRMIGNVEDVEAIGQEVFLRAFRFAPTYRYPSKFSTWVFTIARNLAINNARRKKRNPVRSFTELKIENADHSGSPFAVAATALGDLEKREQIERVLIAMDDLPPDQKEVIVLGIFQDLTYAQMEEITGAKAVTLRSRMFHGLKKLGRMMGQIPPSAAE